MKIKKVFFAHSGGAQGSAGQGSFDLVLSLKKELRNEFEIHYPLIDGPEDPSYQKWKNLLAKEFKNLNEPVILIGHSLGGSVLLKYISEEKPDIYISSLYLVATPQWGKNGWGIEEFELRENFEHELGEIEKVYLYHCKEDSIVPFKHLNFYKKAFPNAIVRVLDGTDHVFSNGLPELVSDIKLNKS
ncbi:alpha/beta hydrolase [Mariniflexile litorale]|uniref:Alpha/beta hydrolase n=1 Tax=Mariniflexile litorale TaxID=3045158 RepID=A0AAU7ECY5_9FLAO|nr:alpha/beta hydrolase [Mariniflexile sp. KMM 9835]